MKHVIRYQQWPVRNALMEEWRQNLRQTLEQPLEPQGANRPSVWPAVEIREEADRFVVLADLPGVDPQQVEILADKGVLSLSGERAASAGANDGGQAYNERVTGAFQRRFTLPDNIDTDAITAQGAHGVLEISLPKHPEKQARRIEVGQGSATAH